MLFKIGIERKIKMNSAKQKFLDNLYDETRIEITRQVEAEVIVEMKKKLKVMVSNKIITDTEAQEFAKSKDISLGNISNTTNIRATRVTTPADPCTRSISPTAHC